MTGMQFAAPSSIDEAVATLNSANGSAKVLAGGTDLLVQLRAGMVKTGLIVDIKRIPEVRQITAENGGFRVGAAVCGAELNEHAELKAMWPGVAEAVDLIGSTQIQGRASAIGNLCNASPAADSVPALFVAGAICTVAGPNGTREVPVEEIPTGPGSTSLGAGEFIVSFTLPARPKHTGDAYLRMIPRTEMDIAICGAGVCLSLDDDGTCTAARIAIGAVAPTVLMVPDAAAALVGTKVDAAALDAAAAAASAAAVPIDDKRGTVAYRKKVVGVLTKRAAAIALDRAGSN